jgi:hypothetical protein
MEKTSTVREKKIILGAKEKTMVLAPVNSKDKNLDRRPNCH